MGRRVNALHPSQAWRVAALSMMNPDDLRAAIGGDDAAAWVEAAAACGIAEAQIRFGRMLLEGEGIGRDPVLAFAMFRDAAAQGNADAENMVGRCFENGWGVAIDFARAAHWYRKAAERGLAWAQYNLGHLLLDGNGIARDRDAAFLWYLRAADQGHARAMNLVARCFEEGWGTECDPRIARNWYRRSAEGGYFRGAYNYATILAQEGCTTAAGIWFSRALAAAPEPTRTHMRRALSLRPSSPGRRVAGPDDPIFFRP
jgi:TPR repeat protein